MKIPNKVRILGHVYEVIKRNREVEDGTTAPGTCDNDYLKIWIHNRAAMSIQEEIFMHEIIEAINCLMQLQLTHPQISQVSASLYQVLTDNELLA